MSDIQKTNSSVNWDRFVIKGESMEPTLHTGEGVWVNKLLMGARIYTKFDFDNSPRSSVSSSPRKGRGPSTSSTSAGIPAWRSIRMNMA